MMFSLSPLYANTNTIVDEKEEKPCMTMTTAAEYWMCEVVLFNFGLGGSVAGTGMDVNYPVAFVVCWELEGNGPGGKPTGELVVIPIMI